MTSLFQIDHDLTTTLHDLSDEELSSFIELHGDGVDEPVRQNESKELTHRPRDEEREQLMKPKVYGQLESWP